MHTARYREEKAGEGGEKEATDSTGHKRLIIPRIQELENEFKNLTVSLVDSDESHKVVADSSPEGEIDHNGSGHECQKHSEYLKGILRVS